MGEAVKNYTVPRYFSYLDRCILRVYLPSHRLFFLGHLLKKVFFIRSHSSLTTCHLTSLLQKANILVRRYLRKNQEPCFQFSPIFYLTTVNFLIIHFLLKSITFNTKYDI
jgi:hypothetical protein